MRLGSFFRCLFLIGLLIFWFINFENNSIKVTQMEMENKDIPAAFDGYEIVQLSDLHSKYFGNKQEKLIRVINKIDPDMIVMTGDMIDIRRYDDGAALELAKAFKNKYPMFFIPGNHEIWSGKYNEFSKKLVLSGVTVFRNGYKYIASNGEAIAIAGIDEGRSGNSLNFNLSLKRTLKELSKNNYIILLAHRPEEFPEYLQYSADLIFTGHAHGGQIRIPFAGGLYAPGQGFFPKYTAGMHVIENSAMVISRGLGNSVFPLRVFNRPEVVVVTFRKEK